MHTDLPLKVIPASKLESGARDVAIDNNPAERALRPIALGRKNFLFAGSNAGGADLLVNPGLHTVGGSDVLTSVAPGLIEPTGIELPPTVIAAPAVRVPAPTLGTRVAGLQAELVRRVEEDLAYYVGPVAKVLVRKAAPNSATLEALYQALAVNIAGEADRAAFLRKAHQMPTMSRTAGSRPGGSKPGGTGSGQTGPTSIAGTGGQPGTGGATGIGSLGFGETGGSTGMADPELEKISRDLTVILGPIASVLIRRLAPKAGSIGQLYRLLAEHIPNPDDRDKFLKKAPLL